MQRKENFKLPPGWPVRDGTFARGGKLGLAIVLFMFLTTVVAAWAADKPAQNKAKEPVPVNSSASTPADQALIPAGLNWYSFNSGGATFGTGGGLVLGYSVGQSVVGSGTGGGLQLDIGFWNGACSNAKGDMDGSGGLPDATDVILLLNCVFLGTGNCDPCFSDVDCSGGLPDATDVIQLLNKVFLGTPFSGC